MIKMFSSGEWDNDKISNFFTLLLELPFLDSGSTFYTTLFGFGEYFRMQIYIEDYDLNFTKKIALPSKKFRFLNA